MDFGFYYNPAATPPIGPRGLIRGGFWDTQPPELLGAATTATAAGRLVHLQPLRHHRDRAADRHATSASRRARSRRAHYFDTMRTLRRTATRAGRRCGRSASTTTHLGVPVFEGAYRYRGIQFVPSWGGDMFEALMPDLFVPEARWGPRSWGRNHPATVAGQIEHGLNDASYGYWGFSPASDPFGGYREWGVDAMGMDTDGYPSDVERTNVRRRLRGLPRRPVRAPAYGDGVVTPHAAFLALPYAKGPVRRQPGAAEGQLRRVRARRLLRRGRGAQRHGGQAVPVARPGHDHGRARQRAGARRRSSGRSSRRSSSGRSGR